MNILMQVGLLLLTAPVIMVSFLYMMLEET